MTSLGFPGGTSGKELACQSRRPKRCRFIPWVEKIPWKRAWQPTPIFLLGESHGQRKLAGYSPWGGKELDTTKETVRKKKKKKCARMCEITNGEVVGERCYNLISQANTYQLLHITAGEGNGTPLQYSCLENPMDRGACGLQSMGSPRVRHN